MCASAHISTPVASTLNMVLSFEVCTITSSTCAVPRCIHREQPVLSVEQMLLACPRSMMQDKGSICTCEHEAMPVKQSHDRSRLVRNSQRRLSPNGAQTPGMAALMIGRYRARSAEIVSARWYGAGGAVCQNTSSFDARARIVRLLRGSTPISVLHLAEAFLPRLLASATAKLCNCHKKCDRYYLLPSKRQVLGLSFCIRCRKLEARSGIFRVIARRKCSHLF